MDRPVSTLRDKNLLLKPVTQMALAHAARLATAKGIPWEVMAERLDRVDWSFDNELWFNILIIGSTNRKMITGKESIRSAGLVISYLVLGNEMAPAEKAEVLQIIRNAHNNDSEVLPETYE